MKKIRELCWRPSGAGLAMYSLASEEDLNYIGDNMWCLKTKTYVSWFKEVDGKLILHRDDGPAESFNVDNEVCYSGVYYMERDRYYLDGVCVTKEWIERNVYKKAISGIEEDMKCLTCL